MRVSAAVFLIVFLPALAHAHKVNVFAYAEGGKVFSEGYFADGARCKNSKVEVFDAKTGERLSEGRTDGNGAFSFDIPRVSSLRLALWAGEAHMGQYTIPEEEIKKAYGRSSARKEKAGEGMSEKVKTKGQIPPEAEIEAAIERAVEKKLAPVMRTLAGIREEISRPGPAEILGGIGYIVGIAGIVMYFLSRKRG